MMYFIATGIGLVGWFVLIIIVVVERIGQDNKLDQQCQREYAESLRHSQD